MNFKINIFFFKFNYSMPFHDIFKLKSWMRVEEKLLECNNNKNINIENLFCFFISFTFLFSTLKSGLLDNSLTKKELILGKTRK